MPRRTGSALCIIVCRCHDALFSTVMNKGALVARGREALRSALRIACTSASQNAWVQHVHGADGC